MSTPTPRPRRVLVLGGRGFIGRHIVQVLVNQGHEVLVGARQTARSQGPGHMPVDMAHDTRPEDWLPRLTGVDAVINAVGVLRSPDMVAIHHQAPAALFDACAQAGVRRVVQISALGIEGVDRPYATTKRAADDHLIHLTEAGLLEGVVVRPSLVMGQGGASAALFDRLARWPLLPLPRAAHTVRTQPIAVHNLAQLVAHLTVTARPPRLIHAVGPDTLTLAQWVACRRAQVGRRHAIQLQLPDGLTRLSAHLADRLPWTPWGMDTLTLLEHHPTVDSRPTQQCLGAAWHSALSSRSTP